MPSFFQFAVLLRSSVLSTYVHNKVIILNSVVAAIAQAVHFTIGGAGILVMHMTRACEVVPCLATYILYPFYAATRVG